MPRLAIFTVPTRRRAAPIFTKTVRPNFFFSSSFFCLSPRVARPDLSPIAYSLLDSSGANERSAANRQGVRVNGDVSSCIPLKATSMPGVPN